MKLTTKLFAGILIACLFPSCSYHIGTMSGGNAVITNQVPVSVRMAYGTARTTHFLGIGGNKKQALVFEAKKNLYLSSDLKPGEAIGQTTVDFKRTFLFPFWSTRVTVSADVLDFSASPTVTDDHEGTGYLGFPALKGAFARGQEVYYISRGDSISAEVLDIRSEKYVIRYFDDFQNLKIKTVLEKSLFALGSEDPRDIAYPDKFFTPENPTKKLVRFLYEGKKYTGELLDIEGMTYTIRVEDVDGSQVEIQVPEKDILH